MKLVTDIHPCHDRRFVVDRGVIVPVAMSSTLIAMSVLRMEPVWMTTGQVAGLAAAEAKDRKRDVAQIDPEPLPKILRILTDPNSPRNSLLIP